MNILAIAPSPPYVQVAEGTFTRANSRLSLVDGTAFFDCGADLSAYAGLDSGSHEYYLKVYSKSNGASIGGYVGAKGLGVAYSVIIDGATENGNMETGDPPTGWSSSGVTIDGVADERTGGAGAQSLSHISTGAGWCYNNISYEQGALLRFDGWAKKITANYQMGLMNNSWTIIKSVSGTSETWENLGFNWVPVAANGRIILLGSSAKEARFDDISLKKYTDCAVTGFHIISAQGGSTQNWQNVHGSFENNDDNYSYKLYKVR